MNNNAMLNLVLINGGVGSMVWFFGGLSPFQIICLSLAAIYTAIKIIQALINWTSKKSK